MVKLPQVVVPEASLRGGGSYNQLHQISPMTAVDCLYKVEKDCQAACRRLNGGVRRSEAPRTKFAPPIHTHNTHTHAHTTTYVSGLVCYVTRVLHVLCTKMTSESNTGTHLWCYYDPSSESKERDLLLSFFFGWEFCTSVCRQSNSRTYCSVRSSYVSRRLPQ